MGLTDCHGDGAAAQPTNKVGDTYAFKITKQI